MVLAQALHQARHDQATAYRDDHDADGVYLFADQFPEYDNRMEAMRVAFGMWMQWDCGLALEEN